MRGNSGAGQKGKVEDYPFYAGIDVGEEALEVAVKRPGRTEVQRWSTSNDAEGIGRLLARLSSRGAGLVVMEATGGLHRKAARRLQEGGIFVAVLNPRRVRNFGLSGDRLAKTDRLDALVLAEMAEERKPEPRPLCTREEEDLADLVQRRSQLVRMQVMETNRLRTAPPAVRRSVKATIRLLQRQADSIKTRIEKKIERKPEFRAKSELLCSVPGVGPVMSSTLISSLPELGRLEKGQIARLAGVAPINNDSGKHRGRRSCWGGRANVRAALYMSVISGIRWNPVIRRRYHHLRSRGKSPNLAITACMHKLLLILDSMLRHQTRWLEHAQKA